MLNLVADASVMSSFFLDEEYGEEVQRLIEENARFYAPLFWRYEVANAVWKRKEIPAPVAQGLIEQIWDFTVYSEESVPWAHESFAVARKHNVTFYDSAYIVMAKLLNIPLWTLDRLQGKIAARDGVTLWEE